MSAKKTKSLPQSRFFSLSRSTIRGFREADLPVISTTRTSRNLNNIQEEIETIQQELSDLREDHQQTDKDGDLVVRIYRMDKDEPEEVCETGIEKQGQRGENNEYKADLKEEMDLGEDEDLPAVREEPVFEDREEWQEARDKFLEEEIDIEVYMLPEDELEGTFEALAVELSGGTEIDSQSAAEQIKEKLDLDEKEESALDTLFTDEILPEIWSVLKKEKNGVSASNIMDVDFMLPIGE